ncbi:XRE family transcriptional regulator [Erythrobacter longus]|uniref:XRE family transcriptional regulator n=1 Tax=Erythrobacter longus TaxID=1044 RepID=A0A074MVU5_ERYLO|nr:helix-turn-helix transcriptional regulator [Erythrobacter longus]KEO89727.1 XRE family transcriptional regulator [Erythrobacter longus]
MTHYNSSDLRPLSMLLSDFGQQLEAYRISRNLKQAELAELAGISRSTLSRLESGNGGTIDSLARIMRALDIEDRLLDIVPDAKLSPLDPRSDTGRARQRVRKPSASEPSEDWSWGDEAP